MIPRLQSALRISSLWRAVALLLFLMRFHAGAQDLPFIEETFTPAAPLEIETYQAAPTRFNLILHGNTRFTLQEIQKGISDQIEAIEQSGLSDASADDTAFFLTIFYKNHGYPFADVEWKVAGRNTLVLNIKEGPLVLLKRVEFKGNEGVATKTLYDILIGATRERLPRKPKEIPFVEADIKSGVQRIRGYYQSEGYLDSEISDPVITFTNGNACAEVTISIHEGIQYRFGKITFEGDILFLPHTPLLKELKVFTDKPYTPLAVTNLERKVDYFYRSRGYFKVTVRAESDPADAVNGEVPVKFVIVAGNIYHFDGITERGLTKLRPSFLKNRFKSLQGQTYSPAKVEERYRTLMGTGLFTELRLKQTPIEGNLVRLDFDAKEAQSQELGFSVGYGTLEGGIFGTRYLNRNLFGFGRPLSVNAEIAQNLLRGEVLYTDPWLFDTNYTLRLRLYGLSQTFSDYAKVEYGFRGEIARKITKNVEVSIFLLARAVSVTRTGSIDPLELGPTDYFTNSLGTSLTIDYRDNILNPTRGWVINATVDSASHAIGSSIDFFRTTGRISYYLPIKKSLLAFGLRGGLIIPFGPENQLPIDERFFNGGSRSVRSYVERSLGPKDSGGHSVGGETFTTFNIEYDFPIWDNLVGAFFFDAGSVGRRLNDGLGVTGFAIGTGLRYKTPIGPIRLDYGHNPIRKADEPTGAWNLSFGFAF